MNSVIESGRLEETIELSVHSARSRVTDDEGNTTESTGERNSTRLHEVNNAKKLEELNTIVEKEGKTINGLLALAFTLANYYCVSQAVVFTALSSGDSSSLKCHDVWFPLVLSLLPGFLNLGALCVIGNMYIEAYTSRDRNLRHHAALVRTMRPEASLFTGDEANRVQLIAKDPELKKWLQIRFCACIIPFACLAIIIAFGSAWILCPEKLMVKHHGDDGIAKCLKLCDGGKCIRICPES